MNKMKRVVQRAASNPCVNRADERTDRRACVCLLVCWTTATLTTVSDTKSPFFPFPRPVSMPSYSNGSGEKRESSRDEDGTRDERKRKRKSRWGNSETDRVIIPGLPTVLPSNITPEQEKTYLCE